MNSVRTKNLFNVCGATSTVPSDDNPSHRRNSTDVHLPPYDDQSFRDDTSHDDLSDHGDETLDEDFLDSNVSTDERSTVTTDTSLDDHSSDSYASADERSTTTMKLHPATSYQLSSKPLVGYHVQTSFKNRLWRNIKTIRLGFELYEVLFRRILYHSKRYCSQLKNTDQKILQFLFSTTTQLDTRVRYINFLGDLCLLIKDPKDVQGYQQVVKNHIHTSPDSSHPCDGFPFSISEQLSLTIEDKIKLMVEAFQNVVTMAQKEYWLYAHNCNDNRRLKYQTLRVLVFQEMAQFGSNHAIQQALRREGCLVSKTKQTDVVHGEAIVTQPRNVERSTSPPRTSTPLMVLPKLSTALRRNKKRLSNVNHTRTASLQPSDVCTPTSSGDEGDHVHSDVDERSTSTSSPEGPQLTDNGYISSSDLTIVDDHFLENKVYSALYVDAGDILLRLEASPFDIYLASDLFLHQHWRRTIILERNKKPTLPRGRPVYSIDSSTHTHIDKRMDLLSVVRNGSDLLKRRELHSDLTSIAQFCVRSGKKENGARQKSAWTMNFGVKGELSQTKSIHPENIFYGSQNFSFILDDVQRSTVKQSLANAIDYIWLTANDIQKHLQKNPLGMDTPRLIYGRRVADIFGCKDSQFECVTLVVMPLTSSDSGQCAKHKDKMNDSLPAYRKTACMSVVFRGRGDALYLFQIICNFRVSVGRLLSNVDRRRVDNLCYQIRAYHQNLRQEYRNIFPNKDAIFLERPDELKSFYLDESIPFSVESVTKDSLVKKPFIKLPIGTSRVLSMSGFLAPVYENVQKFSYEQLIEIFFFASFLASPAAFNHSFRQLYQNENKVVGHPFLQLHKHIVDTFGKLSAGIHPRYSPCNNTVNELCKTLKSEDGKLKLKKTVYCLSNWISFVDQFRGINDANQIPLSTISSKMKMTLRAIKSSLGENSLDFADFRLSIFTVLASALGLCEPGEHLHHFFFPMRGYASCNHLDKPMQTSFGGCFFGKTITEQPGSKKESRSLQERDQLMQSVSSSMAWKPYRRDNVELHLCESVPNRYLGLKDLFVVGDNIFLLQPGGHPMTKAFGGKDWVDIDRSHVVKEKKKYHEENQVHDRK